LGAQRLVCQLCAAWNWEILFANPPELDEASGQSRWASFFSCFQGAFVNTQSIAVDKA